MEIIFYAIIFIIGIVLGTYWATKAIELPKSLDLRKTYHSNYKNEELVSEVSYILIGGITSIIMANSVGLSFSKLDLSKIIIYVFGMMYISTLVLIAGIDRKYSKIEKRVIAFGIISSIIYMLYLSIVDLASVHLNALYLGIYMILLVLDSFLLKRCARDSYIVNLLMLFSIILVYTDLRTLTFTLAMTVIAILLYSLILKIHKKKNGNKKIKINEIPVGYFIGASNVIVLFMIRIFENYLI